MNDPNGPVEGKLPAADLSEDGFLGHRLKLLQPKKGFRAGSDAVFLAASLACKPGDEVLDAGCGVGAISLCLAWRFPQVQITGLELQDELLQLCRENIARNELSKRVEAHPGDLARPPRHIRERVFDIVVSNPPFYDEAKAQASPNGIKATAHMEGELGLEQWIDTCLRRLKPGGLMALIHTSERLGDILGALQGKAGNVRVFPLWPNEGSPSNRVIIQARKGRKGPLQLLPGLVVHQADGSYHPRAEAILRHGEGLPLDEVQSARKVR